MTAVSAINRKWLAGALAIIALAIGLRAWQLGAKSLWIDEASSLYFADRPLTQIVTDTEEFNPPLYYALLHGWIALFGTSEAALRSLSALFGVLAVGLTGWVGWLLGGRRLALWAMALMAVMPAPLVYSQMARTYTLFMASSLASFGFLLAWERNRSRRDAVGYLLSTIVMCYAHNFWIFNVLVQQLYIGWRLLQHKVAWRQWTALTAGVFLGFLPWLVVQVSQAAGIQARGSWSKTPGVEELLDALQHYLVFGLDQRFIWCFLAIAALGLLPQKNRARHHFSEVEGSGWLLLLLLVIPLGAPFVWAHIGTPVYHQRYAIMSAVALYLLIARGIVRLRRPAAQAAVAGGLLLLAAVSLPRYYASEKEPWRSVARMVESAAVSEDAVIAVSGDRTSPLLYYYHGAAPVHLFATRVSPAHEEVAARHIAQATAGRKRVWMVTRRLSLDEGPNQPFIAKEFFRQHPAARLIRAERFSGHLNVYGYDVDPQRQTAKAPLS